MRQDGTAPDTLIVQVLNFARPQFESAWPTTGPSHVQLFEEETGIKIEFIETDPASEYQDNLKNASTKNGSFDIVTSAVEEIGDFVEAGLILPIDDYVATTSRLARSEFGFAGRRPRSALYRVQGRLLHGRVRRDTQPCFYRSDCSRARMSRRHSRTSTADRSSSRSPGSTTTRSRSSSRGPTGTCRSTATSTPSPRSGAR
jgi:hypothetical protein